MVPILQFGLQVSKFQHNHNEFYKTFLSGGEDAEIFRNRKSYFSINTQIVCDSELMINNIVARWPGSTHDATVFINSRLRNRFEAGEFQNAILLGEFQPKIYL